MTPLEKLLLPFMHFLLLSFLPIDRMRRSLEPAFGAGCGQLFLAGRDAYESAGGHAAIRASLHDGITLPKASRRAGFRTDLCDLTNVATCRMYRSSGEVWRGLAKNAIEGMAAPGRVGPFTALLLVGQVLPVVLLIVAAGKWLIALSGGAVVASHGVRFIAARHFRQPVSGVPLHIAGVLILLGIQFAALARHLLGIAPEWKGRSYSVAAEEGPG